MTTASAAAVTEQAQARGTTRTQAARLNLKEAVNKMADNVQTADDLVDQVVNAPKKTKAQTKATDAAKVVQVYDIKKKTWAPDVMAKAKDFSNAIGAVDSSLWHAAQAAQELKDMFTEARCQGLNTKVTWESFCSEHLQRNYKTIQRWMSGLSHAKVYFGSYSKPAEFSKVIGQKYLPPIALAATLAAQPIHTPAQQAYLETLEKDVYGGKLRESSFAARLEERPDRFRDRNGNYLAEPMYDSASKSGLDSADGVEKALTTAMETMLKAAKTTPKSEVKWKLVIETRHVSEAK